MLLVLPKKVVRLPRDWAEASHLVWFVRRRNGGSFLSAAALQGVCPEPVLASVRFSYETAQGQAEASAPHLEEEPLHAGNLGAGLRRQELPRLLCEVEEDGACEKPPFLEPPFHIQTINRSIYLDRLGTNMGKADPQGRSFSAAPDSKTVCGKTGFF